MTAPGFDWEPGYGFCARNVTPIEDLARTLEAIRQRICAYRGAEPCDCKYGRGSNGAGIERTGCPELRELIHRLLHRPETLTDDTAAAKAKGDAEGRASVIRLVEAALERVR